MSNSQLVINDLHKHLDRQIKSFEEKLKAITEDGFSEVSYCKRYLVHLLAHKKYYLEIYSDLLFRILKHSNKNLSEIVLVDYGAGSGLFGLFAKWCGFKKVYINDINQNCIDAVKKLATHLNIQPDGYIQGDVNEVHQFFRNDHLDIIAGTDVIEHIYDLSIFFQILKKINPDLISGFTTGSNPLNYFKVRQLQRIQIKDEYEGRTSEEMFGDNQEEAFFKQRFQIIQANFEGITDETIERLSTSTRGMNKEDIIFAVDKYVSQGAFPRMLKHRTNTCDPLSGSWTEKILSLDEYTDLFDEGGFNVQFYSGFYNEHDNSLLKKNLNLLIRIFGKRIAPYIILIGNPKT